MPSRSADVGQCGEDPNWGCVKGHEAEGFQGIARGAPDQEGFRELFVGVDALDAADLLDQEAERRVHHVLIEPAAAYACGDGDLADLANDTRPESGCGSDEPL